MRDSAGEVRTFPNGPHYMDVQMLDDIPQLIYNSSERTQDVV